MQQVLTQKIYHLFLLSLKFRKLKFNPQGSKTEPVATKLLHFECKRSFTSHRMGKNG